MTSSSQPFDYLIFIGRFQPFHHAHKEVIDIAFSMSRQVILILGSAQNERTIKNPFLADERRQMILQSVDPAQRERIKFIDIIDLYDDQKWVKAVKDGVAKWVKPEDKIGLIGHFKDESSYYLRLFPEWRLIELDNLHQALSATPLREKYFRGEIDRQKFPLAVQHYLQDFQQTEIYQQLQQKFQEKDSSPL